jgi:hypothetical protein
VRRNRLELWPNDWILHHDNAPAHKALSVKQFLPQKLVTEMEHPSCSPDWALDDFCLLPKVKFALKGRRFQDNKDIQYIYMMTALKALPQQEFQKCFEQLQNRSAKCIAAQGE